MATITDLPYELLYRIIFLLVQSSVGAADFARIISVCKTFSLFAEDELLKLVKFDMTMELKNIYQYQHVNGLLVKCSEAGNVFAQVLLGKVILVSSAQLVLREWQKAEYGHFYDYLLLRDLRCILGTYVQAQNCRVDSFINYFLPIQASTSGSSQTRLVHYQLVKYFLLHGSHRDLAEMSVLLESYMLQFTSVTKSGSPLFRSIKYLVASANMVKYYEDVFANANRVSGSCEGCLRAANYNIGAACRSLAERRVWTLQMFENYWK